MVASSSVVISRKAFLDMIRAKEEFDSVVESIELENTPEVLDSIERSREDIKVGRVRSLQDVLGDYEL